MTPDPVKPIADIVLSAEVPRTTVQRVPAEQVRISRRVVSETRTITVEVRREELHIERVPVPVGTGPDDRSAGPNAPAAEPVLTWILHEEVPEVANRVVAAERVQVFIDNVGATETVTADLRREQLSLSEEHLPPTA